MITRTAANNSDAPMILSMPRTCAVPSRKCVSVCVENQRSQALQGMAIPMVKVAIPLLRDTNYPDPILLLHAHRLTSARLPIDLLQRG